MQRYQQNGIARGGFTLVEILVVIAIIAILATLSVWAATAMIANRQRSNTEATIRVLNKLLQTRWAAVIADAKKETASNEVLTLLADSDTEVAKVLWIKMRLVEAFPMQYKETSTLSSTVVNTYIPANRRKPYFAKYQQTLAPLTGGTPGESAACLLMALKSLHSDGVSIDDQIKQHAIAPNDGAPGYAGTVNNINTLIDGFGGTPLKFKRFFTGAPNPAQKTSRNFRFGDTTDSDGRLIVPKEGWYLSNSGGQKFAANASFHQISPDDINAYYVVPLISSAARDGIFGTADDIFSYQLGVE